jgi:hypothetical protein
MNYGYIHQEANGFGIIEILVVNLEVYKKIYLFRA